MGSFQSVVDRGSAVGSAKVLPTLPITALGIDQLHLGERHG
jgi:hypothetical protein